MLFRSVSDPKAYVRRALRALARLDPNVRGASRHYPGAYDSPLIDIAGYLAAPQANDGAEMWESIDLRGASQRELFQRLMEKPLPRHLIETSPDHRYSPDNTWFGPFDALVLAEILQTARPSKIIEIGSGYSSAVILDTVEAAALSVSVTLVEPYPDRLLSLLRPGDENAVTILKVRAQDVPVETFGDLGRDDILFIDSSHVAKVASDVAFLFLRILPRLRPGALVHVHDIFYPESYPADWIGEGIAWNESLFLRALLAGNGLFEVVAFNAFALNAFPEVFSASPPTLLARGGGSIWLRKI